MCPGQIPRVWVQESLQSWAGDVLGPWAPRLALGPDPACLPAQGKWGELPANPAGTGGRVRVCSLARGAFPGLLAKPGTGHRTWDLCCSPCDGPAAREVSRTLSPCPGTWAFLRPASSTLGEGPPTPVSFVPRTRPGRARVVLQFWGATRGSGTPPGVHSPSTAVMECWISRVPPYSG